MHVLEIKTCSTRQGLTSCSPKILKIFLHSGEITDAIYRNNWIAPASKTKLKGNSARATRVPIKKNVL